MVSDISLLSGPFLWRDIDLIPQTDPYQFNIHKIIALSHDKLIANTIPVLENVCTCIYDRPSERVQKWWGGEQMAVSSTIAGSLAPRQWPRSGGRLEGSTPTA